MAVQAEAMAVQAEAIPAITDPLATPAVRWAEQPATRDHQRRQTPAATRDRWPVRRVRARLTTRLVGPTVVSTAQAQAGRARASATKTCRRKAAQLRAAR